MRWAWVLLVGALVCGVAASAAAAPHALGATPNETTPDALDATANANAVSNGSTGASNAITGASNASTAVPDESADDSSVAVDAQDTYAGGDSVTVELSGTQGSVYTIYLYDATGQRVTRIQRSLDADRAEVDFGELDSGSYRVVVVEANTGAQATAAFGVGGPYEPGVVPEVTVDQPADVVTVDLALPDGVERATVELTGARGEYEVTATVVDRDGDGVVTLDWNTFYAGRDDVSVTARGPDVVENATRERDLNEFLPEGEYALTVSADGRVLDRGAVVVDLEPLYTLRINVLEGPATGSPEESFEQAAASGTVEADEWMFVVVDAQGIFGAVDDVEDLRSVGPDQAVLSITPEDGGEPVRLTAADYVHVEEGRIVVGFGPGNDALTPGTSYDVVFRISAAHPYRGGDVTTGVNLQIVEAGSEPDAAAISLVDVDAPEAVDSGALANFTVTLLNRGERTGRVPVSVTIGGRTVERTVTVRANSRETVVVGFDTSRILDGDRQYVVDVNGTRRTGSLVVGSVENTPTLVSGDREASGLPGFTIPAAVAAVAVTGVVARYRRRREPRA